MAFKFFILFLIYISVSVVVESNSKFNVKNDKISELNTQHLKQQTREKRQNNYVYYPYPYNGYQSFYVINTNQRPNQISTQRPTRPPQRPTRPPQRKSTTTQRYSIWDLARKRRDVEDDNTEQKNLSESRTKRQIDDADVDYNYYPYNFLPLFGRSRSHAAPRNQPYTMWDLTRRKRNVVENQISKVNL